MHVSASFVRIQQVHRKDNSPRGLLLQGRSPLLHESKDLIKFCGKQVQRSQNATIRTKVVSNRKREVATVSTKSRPIIDRDKLSPWYKLTAS